MKKALQVSLLFPIYLYRYTLAPLLAERCRFYPTCSEYSIEALKKYGPWPGLRLILIRLGKCQPFSKSYGIDPVPKKTI